MGLGLGPVHRPRHGPARRDAGRERADAVRPERPARELHQRRRPDRVRAHPGRARHRGHDAAPADQHAVAATSTPRRCTATTAARSLAAAPTRAPTLLLPRRLSATRGRTRRRGHRPGDGPHGRARGRRRARRSWPATCARTRTSRSPRLQTLFAREHNRIVDSAARRRSAPSSASRSRAASSARRSSTSPTTSSCRRSACSLAAVPRLRLARRPGDHERVRDRRLPRAQHGARRVRADRRRRARTATAQLAAFAAAGHQGRARRPTASVDARDPAHRRVRQPRPAAAGRARPGARRASAEHEYKNDEQIDNSMRSVLFQIPKPGSPTRALRRRRSSTRTASRDVEDLGADDVQRGRDHGMPTYNALRVAYGLPARPESFTQITGEAHRRAAGRA